jgi:hypothetical protein
LNSIDLYDIEGSEAVVAIALAAGIACTTAIAVGWASYIETGSALNYYDREEEDNCCCERTHPMYNIINKAQIMIIFKFNTLVFIILSVKSIPFMNLHILITNLK